MTKTTATDYSGVGFDLAIGEIHGFRVWRMDDHGRLRARHIQEAPPWRPGVNSAGCYRQNPLAALMSHTGQDNCPACTVQKTPHTAPLEDCKCGFYAYTQEHADLYELGGVAGIVRGTGRTLIGTKGFRCEKAEIVALLDPTSASESFTWQLWQRDRLRALYPQVPMLHGRAQLLAFAPVESLLPDPGTDEFWTMS